ncbi:DUF3141 domain-containing protein [Caldimonas brevitalea]|uniref:Poly(3-hydroxybutyrate) depolymerase n=1 Tax=Caldimonas brevitalea TaxID=413882 RepID=A0A0G3BS41_9BURK|nr:DUF3141 domain-containing protein [Caldimonas brevitalea]AKJ29325.1 poly(3-hydroxybutyrate) depolymerase [Caldimonas brevitalea]
MNTGAQLARSVGVATKVATVLNKRTAKAQEEYSQHMRQVLAGDLIDVLRQSATNPDPQAWYRYAVDATQRSVLFWETLWTRGNNFLDRATEGFRPVLHFAYDTVLDGRQFDRPVNYALLKIVPPAGVEVDAKRRPYLIIDPRAGHGPGIGGFKDDSQVGVALRAGHPVYFVVFFRDPEPGQTLLDVCDAEQLFVKKVRALHPDSPKPAIIGNCQGGWAAMMLAASDPDETGPIVINGAPMSYWSGAWSEGEGDNPMRYSAGLLGGTWLASLTADLGNGKFDGAHLVQNFESLNPANSLWEKFYHLYDRADTEPARYLDFERWWGGYYLMNREEIEWIVRNLFVGNKLWSGDIKSSSGQSFDLRNIRSPIILFASMGDNITPPQQAFNWVADLYESTEDIKSRGQVIVGLKHGSIGHLGIFVSAKVATKEHAQIVSVLKSIEQLPAGLYGMSILEQKGPTGEVEYQVEFQEHRLEDVTARLNRFQRADEKPFDAVAMLSDFNQRAYELFAQPIVQSLSNPVTARLLEAWHPLRLQNWSISRLNPWLSWVAPAAEAVRKNRQALEPDHPLRRCERLGAGCLGAALEHYRAMRDAGTEALFFTAYANLFSMYLADKAPPAVAGSPAALDPREQLQVRQALEHIAEGGYPEAFGRVAVLLTQRGEPLPLWRLEMRKELADTYAEYLPDLPVHRWRSLRGEQEIVVRLEPALSLATLPALLSLPTDRARMLGLLDKLAVDPFVLGASLTPGQWEMLGRIRAVLEEDQGALAPPAPQGSRKRPAVPLQSKA